jgi:hypothetical protein
MRSCTIDGASIETEEGIGDGAYSLLDVAGTPDEIGHAIAEALKEGDLGTRDESCLDKGPLFLNVRIKFWKEQEYESSISAPASS